MEVPTDAVRTLSGTEIGAILVLMTFAFGTVIVFMARYIRALTKQIADLSEARVRDMWEWGEKAQALLRESLSMVNSATDTIEDQRRKVCELNREVQRELGETRKGFQEFKAEVSKSLNCRECPVKFLRGQGGET
jgi:hypothetical protein